MSDLQKVLSGEKLSIKHEYVPGTIHLVDLEGTLHVKKDNGDIILQPQPSSNPNDPLRWPIGKKVRQFGLLWLWAFLLAVAVAFSGPIWTEWTEVFDTTFFRLSVANALCFLFLGMGCLFLQPTALKLGRRFVYLLCTIIVMVALVVGARAKSINYLYVFNILSGFAAAPVDSLVEISSTDVFFVHQRSTAISLLILALYAGSDLGPVACGYIATNIGWRWCFYVQLIIFAVLFVIQIFYMEDTTFRRDFDQNALEDEILHEMKSRDTVLAAVRSGELSSESLEKNKNLRAIVSVRDDSSSHEDSSIDFSIPKRTYWQKMRLMEFEYNDTRSWLTIWYRPFFLITIPAFIWGGILYGSQMFWLTLLSNTQSLIYSAPPFNWSANTVGLTNLAAFIGSVFGMFYGGYFVDWLCIRLARKNGGIMEPEFRVYAMVLPTIINAAGILAYGLGAAYAAPWAVSVVVGQGLLGFAMSSSGAICLSYAVDSYPKVASEGLVIMLFTRNLIGMGFGFAIQPWLDDCGLKLTTWLMFMLSLVINGSFVIIIIWGKRFRRWTTPWYETVSDPNYGELFRK